MRILEMLGNLAAFIGALLCAGSGGARLAGFYHLAGFEVMSLFTGGMALLLFSAVIKLDILASRMRSRF